MVTVTSSSGAAAPTLAARGFHGHWKLKKKGVDVLKGDTWQGIYFDSVCMYQ